MLMKKSDILGRAFSDGKTSSKLAKYMKHDLMLGSSYSGPNRLRIARTSHILSFLITKALLHGFEYTPTNCDASK